MNPIFAEVLDPFLSICVLDYVSHICFQTLGPFHVFNFVFSSLKGQNRKKNRMDPKSSVRKTGSISPVLIQAIGSVRCFRAGVQ